MGVRLRLRAVWIAMLVKVYRYRVRPEMRSVHARVQQRAAQIAAQLAAHSTLYFQSVEDPAVWIEVHRYDDDEAFADFAKQMSAQPEVAALWDEFRSTLDPRYPATMEDFFERPLAATKPTTSASRTPQRDDAKPVDEPKIDDRIDHSRAKPRHGDSVTASAHEVAAEPTADEPARNAAPASAPEVVELSAGEALTNSTVATVGAATTAVAQTDFEAVSSANVETAEPSGTTDSSCADDRSRSCQPAGPVTGHNAPNDADDEGADFPLVEAKGEARPARRPWPPSPPSGNQGAPVDDGSIDGDGETFPARQLPVPTRQYIFEPTSAYADISFDDPIPDLPPPAKADTEESEPPDAPRSYPPDSWLPQ